ncbi:MAG: aldehyde dehydrogenase family protein [Thermodesulfobacteriota bacterium]
MAREYKILVAGNFKKTSRTLEVLNPYDKSLVGVTYLAGPDEADEAIKAAIEAFEILKNLSAHKRAGILEKTADGIMKIAEEFAAIISLEAGKPITEARAEVKRAINTFRIAAEEAKRMSGEVLPLDIAEGSEKRTGIVKRFPVGPVLAITPFNFPLNLVAHKVAPAIACGCPVIVKPADKTPISAIMLGRIINDSGLPPGGISVLPCDIPVAEGLVIDGRIRKLTFTGSPGVGWMLKGKIPEKKVTLELGGNAGVIIEEDADIETAAKRCVSGGFAYAGQVCVSVQRIFVQTRVFEDFKEKLVANVKALKLGDPLDNATQVGPMISEAALKRAEEWVKEAIEAGAVILIGGKRREGTIFEPTVLTNVRPMMKVCSEEVFAPIVTIEPFDDFYKAVRALNDSKYGLQAGVFTRDIKKIFYAYENIEAGGVVINDVPSFRVDSMPYGGVKQSGCGREGVRYAMEEMTEPRLLVLNLS